MSRDWNISVIAALALHGAVLILVPSIQGPIHDATLERMPIEVSLVAAPVIDAAPGLPIPEAVPEAASAMEAPTTLDRESGDEIAPVVEPEPEADPQIVPEVEAPEPEPEPEIAKPSVEPVMPKAVSLPKEKPLREAQPSKPSRDETAAMPPVSGGTMEVASTASIPLGMPEGSGTVASASGDGTASDPGLDTTTRVTESPVRAEPNYRRSPQPEYPLNARRRKQEGLVLLSVRVTAQGRADAVTLKASSGFESLDEAAIAAVESWEFIPARLGGSAIASEIEVPIRFRLSNQ